MNNQGPPGGLPPGAVVMQMLMAKYASMGLSVVAGLKIPDLLGDGVASADELAEKSGSHADSLFRLLRMLASVGVFQEEGDRKFRNNAISSVLRSEVPGSLRALAHWEGGDVIWKFLNEMPHAIETGTPAQQKLFPGSKGIFDILKQHEHLQHIFQQAMSDLSRQSGQQVAEAYDFSGIAHIVDVGGGYGALAGGIKKRSPGTKVTLFDLPHVIEGAKKIMESMGMSGAIETVPGSFFEGVPPADAFIMKFILHDWPDDECVKLLTNCREQLSSPQGKVLVCDAVVGPGPDSIPAKFLDLTMMVGPGGKERTEAEFRDLFARAGLKLERILPTKSILKILELTPA